MTCVLVFVTYGHLFINHQGSWFYKACYYDCGQGRYGWYDIFYRVDPDATCPRMYRDA
jgi:hypothetical protein